MELADFPRPVGEWLAGTGPEAEIVISSRIRLARNLAGFRFPNRAPDDEKVEVVRVVRSLLEDRALDDLTGLSRRVALEESEGVDRLLLVERHLISKEHAHARGSRAVVFDPAETASIMINEEDHLRLQVLASGFDLATAWRRVAGIDAALASRLRFAFDSQLGYLTACPTNVGTGIRVSVMVHLPGLAMSDHLERVKAAGAKLDLMVRGLHGEGSRAHGDFFQISNQCTLGKTEDELIAAVAGILPTILAYESQARRELLTKRRRILEDRVWRAHGTLSSARRISSEEALDCLSALRLGASLGLLTHLDMGRINELFLFSQPAHLQRIKGAVLDPEGRDVARADFLRSRLP